MASYNNWPLIRTLRQISRNKGVSPEVRGRCCELSVLIDPNITFNSIAKDNLRDSALLAETRARVNAPSTLYQAREGSVEDKASRGGDDCSDPVTGSGAAESRSWRQARSVEKGEVRRDEGK